MATLDTIASRYFISKGTLYSLSAQQVIDCSDSYGNDGCDDGYIDRTITYVKDKGIMLESDYNFRGFEQTCNYDQSKLTPVRPTGFTKLASNGDAFKNALAQGPVAALVESDRQIFRLYSKGIIDSDRCGFDADHAVQIVGWGNDS